MNTESNLVNGGSAAQSKREGPVAKRIEQQTAKLPSDTFLWAATAAMAGSLLLQVTQPRKRTFLGIPSRRGQLSLFVGQWVPTLLLFGVYNKMVKLAGSDRMTP